MKTVHPLTYLSLRLLLMMAVLSVAACGSESSADAGAYPSDDQVITDVTPKNKKGLIDVEVVDGKSGEAYLHPKDLVWYWDRGVVVKREANLAGAPDAVLLVGGLARYQKMGTQYKYAGFLTTYNEYEGIPRPDQDELMDFVKANLKKVFMSRDHNIMAVDELELIDDAKWNWHSEKSFSVPFHVRYKHRNSYTTIEERNARFDIRFYRATIDAPVDNLMATEADYKALGTETHKQQEIDQMKTLRSGF